MQLIALAIFSGAFLVFQVQPIVGRVLLPELGGSPAVWTACMLFFQTALLAGYGYAHFLSRLLQPSRQAIVHCGLLLAAALLLPLDPQLSNEAVQGSVVGPAFGIFLTLVVSVGPPFMILSATAPLLQRWFSLLYPTASPFRLYALSNVGSLLALLSYPFVIEPWLTLTSQRLMWSGGFLICLVITAAAAWPLMRGAAATAVESDSGEAPVPTTLLLRWVLYSACGSMMLLAITNQMTQDVAVTPFLWVLPLSLYLVTFIICFERDAWYNRAVWLPILVLTVGALAFLLHQDYAEVETPLLLQIGIYCGAMFSCCMVCHGEMVRSRPDAGGLTLFYLMLSVGGAIGGLFVNLLAPLVFDGYWELHLGLVVCCAIAGWHASRALKPGTRDLASAAAAIALLVLAGSLWQHASEQRADALVNLRGFHGVLHVYEYDVGTPEHQRAMFHGRINHGSQWMNARMRIRPHAYYGPTSGVGLALRLHPNRRAGPRALNVGIVGLGGGAMAAWGRDSDRIRYYEINPQVEEIARQYFAYLEESPAEVEVVIGDARRTMADELERGEPQKFDVLAIDAFSGDAVPVHLLTREAGELYRQHLAQDGVLAFHISNFHLDLRDVVRNLAEHIGMQAVLVEDVVEVDYYTDSDWVLVTNNPRLLHDPQLTQRISRWREAAREIGWTDDFSNLLAVLY